MGVIERIANGKIRRQLMIRERIVFEGGIYHITQRAPGSDRLFLEDPDYLAFLPMLKNTVKDYNLSLLAFALLPNHIHLLIKIKERNLSEAMKNIFEKYAKYFNRKYKRKGHVFSGRFRAALCNDENYLLAISLYIHLNPCKAGLCTDPTRYQWSSIHYYLGEIIKPHLVNRHEIFNLIDKSVRKAKKIYLEMLNESARIKGRYTLTPSSATRFIRKSKRVVEKILGKETDLEQLIEKFKSQKKVTRPQDLKARKYLIGQLLADGHSVREISKILKTHIATIYRVLKCDN